MKILTHLLLYLVTIITISANTDIDLKSSTTNLTDFTIHYYIDKSKKLSIDDIQDKKFLPINNKISLGLKAKYTWIKLSIKNSTNKNKNLYLHNTYGYILEGVYFYEFYNKKLIKSKKFNFFDTKSMEMMDGKDAVFEFDLEANQTKTIYMLSKTGAYQFFEIKLFDLKSSKKELINNSVPSVLMMGILFALAMYNVILYISTRYKEYIYYSLYLLTQSIYQSYNFGLLSHYFYIYGDAGNYINSLILITAIFLALFTREIFETAIKYKSEDRFLISIIVLFSLNYLYTFIDYYQAIAITTVLFSYLLIGFVWITVSILYKGNSLAKYFLLAHSFFVLFSIIAVNFFNGIISFNFITSHANGIGVILEAIILAYLVSYRTKLLQEENLHKDKMIIESSKKAQLGEMLGIIAHQWKQPLSIISSNITLYDVKVLSGKIPPNKETKEIFNNIEEQIDFTSSTVDDFRHFFNPEKKRKKVDLNKAILIAIDLLKGALKSNQVKLHSNIDLPTPIYSYHNEIVQVLINLIKNADEQFNSSHKNREIKILGYEDELYSYIKVQDNAGGIEPKILPKIFDKYFSTKEDSDGTGLGLDLCKTIIHEHCNGELNALNIENGAEFIIKFDKTINDLRYKIYNL